MNAIGTGPDGAAPNPWTEIADARQRDERREFVRAAAIALLASARAPYNVGFTCDDAWAAAQKLWFCKPENC